MVSFPLPDELGTDEREERVRFGLWRLSGVVDLVRVFTGVSEAMEAPSLAALLVDLRADRLGAIVLEK